MQSSLLEHVRFEGRPPVACAGRPQRNRSSSALPVSSTRRPPVELDAAETALVEHLFAHAGLHLSAFRRAPIKRRLQAVLRAVRCDTPQAALASLLCQPELQPRALAALLIGHTLPFRDLDVFRLLRERIVPTFDRAPRVWSIGCSRGLELLSVAVLLAERGLDGGLLRGSDCRRVAPAQDRHLLRDLMAAIPAEFAGLERFATQDCLRRYLAAIEWRCEDVLTAPDAGAFDLILCRNVSIYLELPAAYRLWRRTVESLAPGGWLIAGKAERPPVMGGLVRVAHCVYRRTEGET